MLGYVTWTHVAGMLSVLRNVEALKYVLTNAPLGSKQQAAKEDNLFFNAKRDLIDSSSYCFIKCYLLSIFFHTVVIFFIEEPLNVKFKVKKY